MEGRTSSKKTLSVPTIPTGTTVHVIKRIIKKTVFKIFVEVPNGEG